MLDRNGGKHGIHDQPTGCLTPPDNVAQYVPVPLTRLENATNRLGEPRRDRGLGLVDLLQFSGKPKA
jgi:hypothetical protein